MLIVMFIKMYIKYIVH